MEGLPRKSLLLAVMLVTAGLAGASAAWARPATLALQLGAMAPASRDEARITLQLPAGMPATQRDAARAIAASWNSGQTDAALTMLRAFEAEQSATPLAVGIQWLAPRADANRDDRRIGDRERVKDVGLDYVAYALLNFQLYSVLTFDLAGGGSGWSVNLSVDDGETWQETYAYLSATPITAVSGRVGADYLYVGYTATGDGDNTAIDMQRFSLADASADPIFATQHVASYPVEVREVAVETNADDANDRVFCVGVLADHGLAMRVMTPPVFVWSDLAPGITDASGGLSVHWNAGENSFLASFRSVDDRVHVVRVDDGASAPYPVEDLDSTTGATSIAAYDDQVMVVYEYAYAIGTGIKSQLSVTGGATWSSTDVALPEADVSYREPRVGGRLGSGFAVIFQQPADAGDLVWLAYDAVVGVPDIDGREIIWGAPRQVNDVGVAVGMPMTVEAIPVPVTDIFISIGVIWIGGDTVDQGAYFQHFEYGSPFELIASYTVAHPGPVSVFTRPDRNGQPLGESFAEGGTIVDATITVTLADYFGNPIPFYPGEDMWLQTSGGGLVICAGGSNADHDTDANGHTTFTVPIAGGGHSEGETTNVYIAGSPINQPGIPMTFNGPDIDGNLIVDLSDVTLFAGDFYNAYHYRSDFNWDDVINLSDLSQLASAIAATCGSGQPHAADAPDMGMVAVSFVRDAVQPSITVAPGDLFQAHVLVSGEAVARGLRGLEGRLRTTDNLDIVQWSFRDGQINVSEPPEFMIGWSEPQVAKAAGRSVCALTVTLRATDDRPGAVFLERAAGAGSVLCTIGENAAMGRLIVAGADASGAAAVVNGAGDIRFATAANALIDGSLRNAPNPFNPSTDIQFALARGGRVEARVYDVNGRLVRQLAGEVRGAGPGSVHWDGRDQQGNPLASGLYFSQVFVDGAREGQTIKMSLIK